jgi:hypothetical protein
MSGRYGLGALTSPALCRAQYVVVVVVEDDEGAITGAGLDVVVVRSVVLVAAAGAGALCVSMQPASKAAAVKIAAPVRMRKPVFVVVIA